MSVSFTYGGIDRTQVFWICEAGHVEQCGAGTVPRDMSRNCADADRELNAAYVYGGLDRTPVEWAPACKAFS
jgi:hypothetical protein